MIKEFYLKKRFLSTLNQSTGGPTIVVKNLLKELEMRHNVYWDICFKDIPKNISMDIMGVVNNTDDLQWAINNKDKIGAKELWAGSNLVVVPQESEGILNSDEINKIIVPVNR